MEDILGFLAPLIIYTIIFILNAILPGRWVVGYATKEGTDEKLKYRLNGFLVLVTSVALWGGLCHFNFLPWDWLYTVRWYALSGAFTLGLLFSFIVVIPYPAVKKSFAIDFFLGRAENLQLWGGRIDAKMWLYLIGAILLELNVLSFTAHHYLLYGAESSPGIFLSAALLTYFVCDYLTFEEVHLYTYDLFAERVGFKLGWGCIAFYPFFYTIPLWATVDLANPDVPAWLLILAGLTFLGGWTLARGANMQKYFFKKDASFVFLGIKAQSITDGKRTLLVNGFWGLSRHINYLGEIGMATGIALAVGHPSMILPFLYPLYYVLLLFPRQMDDDKRCAAKYGKLWDEYLEKVPSRIIPKIY
jgi:protein-S-isoprenylcysteine O-methyltransferase Ste14